MKPYAEIQRTVIVRETATQWITTDGSRWSKADAGRCIPRVDGLQIISIEEADRRKQGSS